MSFAFPLLFWLGAPLLLAAALAVHLLNLQRQRPVGWAAMEFLLESERINRVWVNLKQWLLLALRLAALALAAFAIARPVLEKFKVGVLADSSVLHVVLLDDSYSMSDAGSNSSCWNDALAAVNKVLSVGASGDQQQVAILRSSRLALAPAGAPLALTAKGVEEIADLQRAVSTWEPSQTAVPLLDCLARAARLVEESPARGRKVVYVISDGRMNDTQPLGKLAERVASLQDTGAQVRWVACAAGHNENLTISELSLLPGPQTSGVELTLAVAVTNNGAAAVESALVQIERDGRSSPALDMGRIQPRETAVRRFGVLFPTPGEHLVTARLESDAVETDNVRRLAFKLAEERRVLIVDGSPDRRESIPFAAALRPNDQLNTGWRTDVMSPQQVVSQTEFQKYTAVLLLDVANLPAPTADAIKAHTASGAGLFAALGQNADPEFYNAWLLGLAKDPVIPATLTRPHKPAASAAASQGDLVVGEHPLFRVFAGERGGFLSLVSVNYCFGVNPLQEDGRARVLARHGSGQPLMLDADCGRGRVTLLLTTVGQGRRASESWSNLSTLPVFPVLALELVSHLSCQSYQPQAFRVAERWPRTPSVGAEQHVRVGRVTGSGAVELIAESVGAELSSLSGPDAAGYYQIETTDAAGLSQTYVAANPDSAEGDLRLASPDRLATTLGGLGVAVENAVALSADSGDAPSRTPLLLGSLVLALLLGEQALAVACGYHEPKGGRA